MSDHFAFPTRVSSGARTGVFLGVIAASVILNAGEAVIHGVVFAAQWQSAVALLGRTLDTSTRAWILIVIGNAVHCVALVGLGALLGSHFRSLTKVSLVAATAVWAVGWFGPALGALSLDLFPLWLWGVMLAAGYVELIIAAFVGLWVYRRCTATMPQSGGRSTDRTSEATSRAV